MTTLSDLISIYTTQAEMSGFFIDKMKIYNVLSYAGDLAIDDGVTDATSTIQTAINAAAATGGILFFPAGTYIVSRLVLLSSNVYLMGVPGATIFRVPASSYTGVAATTIKSMLSTENVPSSAYVPTESTGAYKFNASGSTKSNINIEGITFDINYDAAPNNTIRDTTYFHAIHLENVEDCKVKNCRFISGTNSNGFHTLAVVTGDNVQIEGCLFDGATGPWVGNSTNVKIMNNRLVNQVGTPIETVGGQAMSIIGNEVATPSWAVSTIGVNSKNSYVAGNFITGSTGLTGITLGDAGNDYYNNPEAADNAVVIGNTIADCSFTMGVLVQYAKNVRVSENTIHDMNYDGAGIAGADFTSGAISVITPAYSSNITINHNTIYRVNRGVYIHSASYITVESNTIYDITFSNSGYNHYGAGVQCNSSSTNVKVLSNLIRSTVRGVYISTSSTNIDVKLNTFQSVRTYFVDGYNAVNLRISGNVGIDNNRADGSYEAFYFDSCKPLEFNDNYVKINSLTTPYMIKALGNSYTVRDFVAYNNRNDGCSAEAFLNGGLNVVSGVAVDKVNRILVERVLSSSTARIIMEPVRFQTLPTSAAGLSTGDIWNDGGTVKIVT